MPDEPLSGWKRMRCTHATPTVWLLARKTGVNKGAEVLDSWPFKEELSPKVMGVKGFVRVSKQSALLPRVGVN
jgi:hypothetical protein